MKTEGIAKSPLAQEMGGLKRAHAVVAVDDKALAEIAAKTGDGVFREAGKWNELGAFDAAVVELVGLAAIDKTVGEFPQAEGSEFLDRDLGTFVGWRKQARLEITEEWGPRPALLVAFRSPSKRW